MSKELKGKNGKIVGTMRYFDENNTGCIIGRMVGRYNFNYYQSIHDISKKSEKIFDEVYYDLKSNERYLSYINKKDKQNTIEILEGMSDLCKIVSGSTSVADKCIRLLANSDKSKSGASDKDITKSAEFVLSNKYFNKKESIKILEDCIKKRVKKATSGKSNMEKFINEVARSTKSGYFEDVLLKVNYIDSGKKIVGKCGKELCSKEYNNYIAKVVTGKSSISGSVEFGKLVRNGLKLVASRVNNDLDKGIKDNDYIIKENVENIKKQVKDLESCGERKYNLIDKANKLDWFVGGDEKKILEFQKKLNIKGAVQVLLEDGVYGKKTADTWIKFFDKLLRLSETAPVVTMDNDDDDWVKGLGAFASGHFIIGGNVGKMVYWDDKGNISIINTYVVDAASDISISGGVTHEWSSTANFVSDMAGNTVIGGASAQIPFTEIGGSYGHSMSFGDGSITSNSVSLSGGLGLSPSTASVNAGVTYSSPVLQFNPKD